jgi:hypothetical protein
MVSSLLPFRFPLSLLSSKVSRITHNPAWELDFGGRKVYICDEERDWRSRELKLGMKIHVCRSMLELSNGGKNLVLCRNFDLSTDDFDWSNPWPACWFFNLGDADL